MVLHTLRAVRDLRAVETSVDVSLCYLILCHGDEGAEPENEGEHLYLPVCLGSHPHAWSLILGGRDREEDMGG